MNQATITIIRRPGRRPIYRYTQPDGFSQDYTDRRAAEDRARQYNRPSRRARRD